MQETDDVGRALYGACRGFPDFVGRPVEQRIPVVGGTSALASVLWISVVAEVSAHPVTERLRVIGTGGNRFSCLPYVRSA